MTLPKIVRTVLLLLCACAIHCATAGVSREERSTPPNSTVCYDEYIGCYDNLPPFDNAANGLPQDPGWVNTTFMLYTRQNPGEHDFQVVTYENGTSVTSSLFRPDRMTRFITHGFTNSGFEPWVQAMKDAFLAIEDANVIVADWPNGAKMPFYDAAAANTRLVGRQLRLLVQKLVREAGLDTDRLHLVGHSLGAHASGYAGRDLGGQLYRITALDPAGPMFDAFTPVLDLDKTDARFVDVVHSNGKALSSGGAGLFRQVGHVDFYINGGKTQPGCRDGLSAVWDVLGGSKVGDAFACSHGRSHMVFTESITSFCPFTAYPCSTFEDFDSGRCLSCGEGGCSELGLYADQHRARGQMFLKTRDAKPLCGFHYSVTVQADDDARETSGQLSVQINGTWGATDVLLVTEEKETLKAGAAYGGMMLATTEVGVISALTLTYTKAPKRFLFFGGGRDDFAVHSITVVSGESGRRYTFCLWKKQIRHDEPITMFVHEDHLCNHIQ